MYSRSSRLRKEASKKEEGDMYSNTCLWGLVDAATLRNHALEHLCEILNIIILFVAINVENWPSLSMTHETEIERAANF